jgi:hypothetical protein
MVFREATVPCLGPEGDGATVSHATRVQARRANRQYKKEKTAEGFAQVASMSHRGQNIVFGVLAVIMLSIAGWFFSLGGIFGIVVGLAFILALAITIGRVMLAR